MTNSCLLQYRRNAFTAFVAFLLVTAVGFAQSPKDAGLRDLGSADLQTRIKALYTLLPPSQRDGSRLEVNSLLGTYPAQAEKIRTTLIAALEAQGVEHQQLMKDGKQMTEPFLEYWLSLTDAVTSLKDPRAVRGLLMATMSGAPASVDGLADICPVVLDSIVARAHEPEMYWQGNPLSVRGQAINVLGACLRRPAANFTPAALSKIREELIAALDDPNWNVRALAATGLIPLRANPLVHAKLEMLSTSDPYVNATVQRQNGSQSFPVREAAARAMNPPKELMFYVTRIPESRACRVENASESLTGDIFLGPTTKQAARDSLCAHYDRTGHDVSLCWLSDPASACGK